MTPWVTYDEMLRAVATLRHVNPGDICDPWPEAIREGNQAAADDIAQILMSRGYTAEQVNAWDQRKTYNRDVGLFWTIVKVGALEDFNDTQINKLDRRKELQTLLLLINGEPVTPGTTAGAGAGIRGGRLDTSSWRFDMNTRF